MSDKKIVITGASSGIGKAAALMLASQGAFVILIARRAELLQETADEIAKKGGRSAWYVADLSVVEAIDRLTDTILAEHSSIDVLFNNAGRSIRRKMSESLERYHDFERCMTLNYFAPVRLIRNLLPALLASGHGQIINSSTWGTHLPAGGFGPYNASKIALDKVTDTLRIEMAEQGLAVTQIHFPLVHTAMSGATESFKKLPGMTSEEAAQWVCRAIEKRPRSVMNMTTRLGRVLYMLFPQFIEKKARSSPFSV